MSATALINNWLFGSMTDGDQNALRPQLVRRDVRQGEVLLRHGDDVGVVHFPVSCLIANVMTLDAGQTLAVSTVGRDGLTGLAAFMAGEPVGWDVIAQVSGVVWSLPAAALQHQASQSEDLRKLLLQATHQNQLEAHCRAICAAFHLIQPRLARWLLTMQEQTGGSNFALTQEDFAKLLGVQRTTIVTAFNTLTANGALMPKTRGRVVIRNRDALKAAACDCHSRAGDRAH